MKAIKFGLVALLSLAVSAALAQQPRPASVAEMQGVAAGLSAQLDAVRGLHLQSEAKAGSLADENARLKARVQELEAKTPKPEAAAPPQ